MEDALTESARRKNEAGQKRDGNNVSDLWPIVCGRNKLESGSTPLGSKHVRLIPR